MLPVPCANAIGIIDRIRTSDDAGFSKDARRKLSSEPKPLTTDGETEPAVDHCVSSKSVVERDKFHVSYLKLKIIWHAPAIHIIRENFQGNPWRQMQTNDSSSLLTVVPI
jgi:hypothetical protein